MKFLPFTIFVGAIEYALITGMRTIEYGGWDGAISLFLLILSQVLIFSACVNAYKS